MGRRHCKLCYRTELQQESFPGILMVRITEPGSAKILVNGRIPQQPAIARARAFT